MLFSTIQYIVHVLPVTVSALGVIFSLLVIVIRTILPYSPSLGETRAWHYPPDEELDDEEFDVEDLRVGGEREREREREMRER